MKSNHLKAFIRYSNKRIVAGSLILAQSMPKTGIWKEVPVDECCSPPANNCDCLSGNNMVFVNSEELLFPTNQIGVTIAFGGGLGGLFSGFIRNIFGEANDIDEMLIFLNNNFSDFGIFTIVDNNIVVTICTALYNLLKFEEPVQFQILTHSPPQ